MPTFTTEQKREAAMHAISSVARKQVAGKNDQGVGRKTMLRKAEETRLVRRDASLRKDFRRLQRASGTTAGTTTRIRGMLKRVRGRIRSAEGLTFKMKGGRKYIVKESIQSKKGRLGIKQASRQAVQEEVEEINEQNEIAERQKTNRKDDGLAAGEKRRQEAKEEHEKWQKETFGSHEGNVEPKSTARASAFEGTAHVSVGDQSASHTASAQDTAENESETDSGPQDMPIA